MDQNNEIARAILYSPPLERRILSIQSHVVHGYVGNRCSVFPLQLHGYEVDIINSVQYSNHLGYKHVRGRSLADEELLDIYDGLKLNDLCSYSYIITGFCGNAAFLSKVASIVEDIKSVHPSVKFVCDPVLGDHDTYYTPKELMPIYRDILMPMADIITPNVFELSVLTGICINSESDCLGAVQFMHERGVETVIVTSGLETENTLFCYASVKKDSTLLRYRFEFPIIHGRFVGTGDVFVSLLIVWLDKLNGDIKQAIQNVIGSMHSILKRTAEKCEATCSGDGIPDASKLELLLVQSRADILLPRFPIKVVNLIPGSVKTS